MKPRMADGATNTSRSWRFGRTSGLLSGFALVLICFWAALQAGCSKEKTVEPSVPVQVTPVEKTTVQQIVSAEAILFPLQQSAVVPKISAPVKTFYVKRGGRVRKGQLLAVLENRDLSAAAEENKGSYEQAQA